MAYNILSVRGADAPDDPLYPQPGSAPDSVLPHKDDGRTLPPITTTELEVNEIPSGGRPRRVVRVRDIKAVVLVSECRVTVACSKFDKGGGWTPWTIGALPVALTANVISKRRAAGRRKGKMLVGHVPYRWVLSIGAQPSGTAIGRDCLRIGTVDRSVKSFRGLTLDITLPRGQSAVELAAQIAPVVASYQLEQEDSTLDAADRKRLEALRTPPPLQPSAKEFASYFFIDTSASDIAAAYQHM